MIEPGTIYHVGVSGGKDSTALLLWAVYESGIPRNQLVASFCDTKNEAECTYEHIRMLNEKVFPIETIETEGFFELAKRKKRFPSTKARFCTQELKLKPTKAYIEKLSERGEVISLSGVRRGESFERSKLPEWGSPLESYFGIREWRPLVDWSLKDVLAIHERYSIPLNPLYGLGARRVGCFPCVMSVKEEIFAAQKYFPETIEKLQEWEDEIGSTVFAPNMTPKRFHSRSVTKKDGQSVSVNTVDDVVRWSKTGKRARGEREDLPPQICLAQHLACE